MKLEKIKDEEIKRRNKADLDLQIKQRLKKEYEDELKEIEPVHFEGYVFDKNSFSRHCEDGKWRSSKYQCPKRSRYHRRTPLPYCQCR